MNVCGRYRTESFGIIVWKRYDKKYRTDTFGISVTITIKQQRYDETIKRHTLAKGPGYTRYNTGIISHTRYQVPRAYGVYRVARVYSERVHHVSGFYRVVWLYGEHDRVPLSGIQFVFEQ